MGRARRSIGLALWHVGYTPRFIEQAIKRMARRWMGRACRSIGLALWHVGYTPRFIEQAIKLIRAV